MGAAGDVTGIVVVPCVEQMRAAVGGADREVPLFGQLLEFVEPVFPHRRADPDQRPFRFRQHIGKLVQVVRVRAGDGLRTGAVEGRGRFRVEHVLGDDNRDRAGGAAFGDVKGARDGLAGLDGVVDLDDEFRDVGEQAGIILFLQCHAPGLEPFHLADEHH